MYIFCFLLPLDLSGRFYMDRPHNLSEGVRGQLREVAVLLCPLDKLL